MIKLAKLSTTKLAKSSVIQDEFDVGWVVAVPDTVTVAERVTKLVVKIVLGGL